MEATQHTNEPWSIEGQEYDAHRIVDTEGNAICQLWFKTEEPMDNQDANAKRIVACVNACAGITNEELADMQRYFGKEGRTYYTLVSDMREAQKQRDELLEALIEINSLIADASNIEDGKVNLGKLARISMNAIKKAKGE